MVTKRTGLLQALAAMPRMATQLVGDYDELEADQSNLLHKDSIYGWLTYLLEVEYYHQVAFKRIVAEEEPRLEAIGLDKTPHLSDVSLLDLLDKLQNTRAETIYFLSHLPSSTWRRLAVHEEHGSVPLIVLVQYLMNYDRLHLNQLATIRSGALNGGAGSQINKRKNKNKEL